LGVPVFSALIVDSASSARWRPLGAFRGHGCHPCPEIAVIRAVTEAVQSRLTYISGSRDDLFPERYRVLQRKEAAGTHGDELATPGTRRFTECRAIDHATFDDDLADILSRLAAAGLREAAVFDLTRAEIGVPVVKVLVPGLENDLHGDRNYRPGPRALAVRARFS
jgi:ribosomal protein S12 methylthiotransferase accessory factor